MSNKNPVRSSTGRRAKMSPQPNNTTLTCPHFLQGVCKFGDQCRHPHIVTHQAPSTSHTSIRKTPSTLTNLSLSFVPSSRLSPSAPSFEPPPSFVIPPSLATITGRKPTCSHFLKGECRFGARCHFLHVARQKHEVSGSRARLPSSPMSAPSVFAPCKFYQIGRCTRVDCSFPHVGCHPTSVPQAGPQETNGDRPSLEAEKIGIPLPLPSDANSPTLSEFGPLLQAAESEANDAELPIEMSLLSCKVAFGAGASVHSITTAFESRTIFVKNIPRDTSQEALLGLLEKFGPIVSFMREPQRNAARVDFLDSRQATAAVEGLTDFTADSSGLSAQFELGAVQTGSATFRSTKVKATWYAPSILVYAHYNTITKARNAAQRLDAMVFEGATIRTICQTPSPTQTDSFSVIIKGLPTRVKSPRFYSQLVSFTRSASVTVGAPTYTPSVGIDRLQTCLQSYGKIDSFDVMDQAASKITAWVQFSSADDAARATKELQGLRQRYVGNSPLWLEQIHSFKYTLPRAHFVALKDDINQFSSVLDVQYKLRYYETHDEADLPTGPVCIRLYSSNPKGLGRTKANLEQLMQGERVEGEGGIVVWNEFFDTDDGRAFLLHVHEHAGAFVECKARTRTLHLHGPEEKRSSARQMLLEQLGEIRAQRHVIPLERQSMRGLLFGGFKAMQDELGKCALVLDVVNQTISVSGDDRDVASITQRLAQISAKGPSYAGAGLCREGTETCPVCFCEATNAIKLPCSHAYDTECLRLLVQTSTTSLQCVRETEDGHACAVKIPLSILRELLAPDEETRLFESCLRSYVNSRPEEFHYCPSPDCPTVYRPARAGTVVHCPACLERICAHCHVEHHEGLSCAEYKDGLSENSAMFQRWKETNGVKACPKCGADIQKNGGCNHIKCARCKIHICWACMETFSNDDSGGGVYAHMRRKHGGIS